MEEKELQATREAVKEMQLKEDDLTNSITAANDDSTGIDAQLSNTLSLVEKQKTYNAELRAKLEGLQKSVESAKATGAEQTKTTTGQAGKDTGKTSPSSTPVTTQTKEPEPVGTESGAKPADTVSPATPAPGPFAQGDTVYVTDETGQIQEGKFYQYTDTIPSTGKRKAIVDLGSGPGTVSVDLSQVSKTPPVQNVTGGTGSAVTTAQPGFVITLNDIIAGKYDSEDTRKIGDMLDNAAAEAEQSGQYAEYEPLLNKAADQLTVLLKKKTAGVM